MKKWSDYDRSASRKAKLKMELLDWQEQLCALVLALVVGPVMLLVGLYWLLLEPVLDLLVWIESKSKKYPDNYLNYW